MMRRLKKDWNQHYRNLDRPCRTDPKFRSMMVVKAFIGSRSRRFWAESEDSGRICVNLA